MGVLGIVLLVIFVIVSILLVLMVVVQDEGSDSLGGIFSGSGNSAFGARTSSVIVKFTYALGALFFVLAFALALVNKGSSGNVEAAAQKKLGGEANTEWWQPSAPAPAASQPAAAPEAPAPAK